MIAADKIKALGICILIPTYNNDQSLRKVLDEVLFITDDIIVVNDGSTDGTADIINSYRDINTVSYLKNKGKGYALRQGFKAASDLGYRYGITLDSDGQHKASDIPLFVEAIDEHPDSLIVGARQMDQENVPGKSNFGNKFSSFWYKVNTGIELPDTQSGFRLYPLHKMNEINWWTNRFEFEVEVLVRSSWYDIQVWSIPIDVYYPPAGERITHFRTIRDFTRISVLNTIFVTMAVLWIRPIQFFKNIRKKSFRQIIKEYIFDADDSNEKIALSVLLGTFIGLTPLIGYHIILAIFFATVLKLNKAVALVAVNISFPPLLPVVMYAGYRIGGLFIRSGSSLRFDKGFDLTMLRDNLIQYLVGSMVMAVVGSIVLSILIYGILMLIRRK